MADDVGVALAVLTSPNVELRVTEGGVELDVVTGPEVELIVTTGVPGPQGEPGSAINHEYVFAELFVWTINHNLGRKPQIRLLTVGGVEFDSFVQHVSDNQAVVTHNTAVAGTAVLV